MSPAAAPETVPADVRPVVPLARGGQMGLWVFVIALIGGGGLIFSQLSERRAALTAPRTAASPGGGEGMIGSPPPLAVPGEAFYPLARREYPAPVRLAPAPAAIMQQQAGPVRAPAVPPNAMTPLQTYPPVPVRDLAPATIGDGGPRELAPIAAADRTSGGERIEAARLVNPAFTVPQGTVIPAVLETALDSTRAGGARALVQRDVFGFDGSRVLIPRGSRLYGEYEADLTQGQKRAQVRWTRLLRPDGVTIALDSPASDPLGRAGIRGKVDAKFLQRFGGALLQSVLDVGVGIAARRASDGVIVALPGSTQNVQAAGSQTIKPTLTVRQGTSVSVFVARDLDFSSVGG